MTSVNSKFKGAVSFVSAHFEETYSADLNS